MVTRDELLEAAASEDTAPFREIVHKHSSSSDAFRLDELLATLSRKQAEELWSSLQMRCTSTLLGFEDNQADDDGEEFKATLEVLDAIVLVAMVTIQMELESLFIPAPLLETALILHGILLSLPESASKLQNNIAKLCEAWWTKELNGKDELVSETFMLRLRQSLPISATAADIKRVWTLRTCLLGQNLMDETNVELQESLTHTLTAPLYLKQDEGRRFLAFLFSLNLNFIETLHKTIKVQIPTSKRAVLECYGEIYFRAWRVATPQFQEKIEQFCIQDLMFHGVHAVRGSSGGGLAANLSKVLGYIHKQKKHRGVDEMLLKLYEPILWRSLKVANGHVRANAAALLIDAFPLQQPDADKETNDVLMQKQFDILQVLLSDPCPIVRVTAVQGVARICNIFWDLIPVATISAFLNKLVHELAWDGTSPDVRITVLKGMAHILDNHLSHPLLRMLLPQLASLLHDTSEKVRLTFLDLLLKVKGMRTIKFWSIAPMDHLLARLAIDKSAICNRIVSLIFKSYMPLERPPDVQLTRAISLLQTNPGAARKFFQFAPRHMSSIETGKFMILLCQCVMMCVKKKKQLSQSQDTTTSDEPSNADEDKENASAADAAASVVADGDQDEDGEDEDDISLDDTDLMAGILESIVILWEGIAPSLDKRANADIKEKLLNCFTRCLPEFFKVFQDPRTCSSLMLLAAHLPPNTIPTFSRGTMSKLRAKTDESPVEEYGTLLEAMCKWGRVADVLELISDWLNAALVATDNSASSNASETSANKSRRARVVTFQDPMSPQPMAAINFLSYMTKQAVCRNVLLGPGKAALREVADILKVVMKRIEDRFVSTDELSEVATDELLHKMFEMYCRLEILLHDPDLPGNDAISAIEELLTWADVEVVPVLREKSKQKPRRRLLNATEMTLLAAPSDDEGTLSQTTFMSSTLLAPKRTAGEAQTPALISLATHLIESLVTVCSNMLLVGVGDRELASHLADFTRSLLKTEEQVSTQFLPDVARLLYQITEFTLSLERNSERDQDEGLGGGADVVPDMLHKVIHLVATLVKTKPEQAQRILVSVKPALTEVLITYFRHFMLHQDEHHRKVMHTLVSAMLAEITNAVKKDSSFEKREAISDLPLCCNFFLSILSRRANMIGLFCEELQKYLVSGDVDSLECLSACLHILYTVSKSKQNVGELKTCITTLQGKLEGLVLPEDMSDDNPHRHLLAANKDTLKECMTHVGMVV